jgi:ankyrin repeat protein
VVKLLFIQDDIDPNSKDKFGAMPLLLAAEYRSEAVVELLLVWDNVNPDPLTIKIAMVGYHSHGLPNGHVRL